VEDKVEDGDKARKKRDATRDNSSPLTTIDGQVRSVALHTPPRSLSTRLILFFYSFSIT
jgi:hypothetical protein